MPSNLLARLATPVGQSLATWIQTVFVVLGVLVANLQLSTMAEQNDGARNKEYFEFYKEYRERHQVRVTEAILAAWRSRIEGTPDTELQREFESTQPEQVLRGYVEHLDRVSDCARHSVCSSARTSEFVCRESKRVSSALSDRDNKIRYAGWKSRELQSVNLVLGQLIARECSYLDATWFRVLHY